MNEIENENVGDGAHVDAKIINNNLALKLFQSICMAFDLIGLEIFLT